MHKHTALPQNIVQEYIEMVEGYDGTELINVLKNYLPKGSSLLELGMGPGKDLDLLKKTYSVTRQNEDSLEELVKLLRPTRAEGMTFSFYVPTEEDMSELTWGSLERRDRAVRIVMRLKKKYSDFIWNNSRTLELTLSENAKSVTDNCPYRYLYIVEWPLVFRAI